MYCETGCHDLVSDLSYIVYIYSGHVNISEYSTASNRVSCPYSDLPCYNLSYYTVNFTSYFTDNTIFSFLDGTYSLQGTLEINGVSNITLQGLDNIE